MIGRGTRLCPDLFAPGEDKSEFYIFDFCANFEYFNENPALRESAPPEPLHKRLFLAAARCHDTAQRRIGRSRCRR